jgi:hypothetical protein
MLRSSPVTLQYFNHPEARMLLYTTSRQKGHYYDTFYSFISVVVMRGKDGADDLICT